MEPKTESHEIEVDNVDLLKKQNKELREEQRERIRKAIENYLPCQNVSAKRTLNEMVDHLVYLVQDESSL